MHSTLSDTGPAGNVYDKYNARNPIARKLMQGFLTSWDRLFDMAAPQDVHEIGCGEGELTRRAAARAARVRGTDVGADAVAEARRRAAHAPYR